MKILVLGANGFVGKNLVSALENVKNGKDRRFPELIIDEIMTYDIDCDESTLPKYLASADFIFNFAGVNRPKDEREFMAGNCDFLNEADFIFNFAGVNRPKDTAEFMAGNCDFLSDVLA
ncbi:MAG: hypothetical protein J6V06_00130, partial [Clostridia bacterium]|nr:hypothetical protein [Clostridia bacterium]